MLEVKNSFFETSPLHCRTDPEPQKDWFDIDVALPKLCRTLSTQVFKLKAELEMQRNSSKACHIESQADPEKAAYETEIVVLQARLKAAELVLSDKPTSDSDLKQHLDKFASGAHGSTGSTQTGVADLQAVSQAAPCSGYTSLTTITALLSRIEGLKTNRSQSCQQVSSAEALRKVQDGFEPNLKALGELLRALRSAQDSVYDAKNGVHGLRKATVEAQKKAAVKRDRLLAAADQAANKKMKTEPSSLDAAGKAKEAIKMSVPERCKIPLVSATQLKKREVSFAQPWLFPADSSEPLRDLAKDQAFAKEVADAQRMFRHSAERSNPSKGKAKILFSDESLANTVAKTMQEPLPGDFATSVGSVLLSSSKHTGPDFLALLGQKMQISFEPSCLPTLKWAVAGSKTIVVFDFATVGGYVRKQLGGRALKQPISSHAVSQYLLSLTADKMKGMLDEIGSNMFAGTMAAGDLLYLPAGCIKAEVPSQEDHIAVRLGVFPAYTVEEQTIALQALRLCQAELLSTNRRNAHLEEAVALLENTATVSRTDDSKVETTEVRGNQLHTWLSDLSVNHWANQRVVEKFGNYVCNVVFPVWA